MKNKNDFHDSIRGKKVLLVGLGILGGGVATAKWLLEKGAELTITDLKDENYLRKSISKLKNKKIKFVLGRHDEEDFKNQDLIVINPDVPIASPYIKIAQENKIPITNELYLFNDFVKSKNIIAVTGTRGKTTTVNWIGYLMNEFACPELGRGSKTWVTGNSPTMPFLKVIKKIKAKDFVVIETPSYHLEVEDKNFKPKVSVVTNIFIDHISRHGSEEKYAIAKAQIFANQDQNDFAIWNFENKWTKKFLQKDLKMNVCLYGDKPIPKRFKNGCYLDNSKNIVLRRDGLENIVLKNSDIPNDFGIHNISNLMIAFLIVSIFKKDFKISKNILKNLPQMPMRQEKIFENSKWKIINDSAATSPEATIAAINRFSSTSLGTSNSSNTFFIIGGTDKGLDYKDLGKHIKKNLKSEQIVLLGGSATDKLKAFLKGMKLNEFETLEECLKYLKEVSRLRSSLRGSRLSRAKQAKTLVVFSPGAKSFEKFKNEFDRGEKFAKTIEEVIISHL